MRRRPTTGRKNQDRQDQGDTPAETCVVFTVPEKRLTAMDIGRGPCVPLPGRKTSIVSVHQQQGPERPQQMLALYTVLTGQVRNDAMTLEAEKEVSRLYRCSEDFVAAMAAASRSLARLAEEAQATGAIDGTRFDSMRAELDAAWLRLGNWHSAMVSTSNRLFRLGKARIAQDKGQSLFCWYGPPVPEYVVVQGTGPYPGNR